MNHTGIVILAAGKSSRLGRLKQLLPYNGKTLLQHVIDEAAKANASPIVVVTGSNEAEVADSISDKKVNIIFNKDWSEGMASGIVAGVRKINELDSSLEKIIITVCDQPFVIASIFEQLDQAQLKSGKNIIASKYSNTKGTPVLFTRKYFSHLLKLQGDHGAKKILEANQEDVAAIDFPKGNIDIDTVKDYKELLGE